MGTGTKVPWYERWFILLVPLTYALGREIGLWRAFLLVLGTAGLLLALVAGTGFLLRRTKKVIHAGEPVPPYFGISYVDDQLKVCVCHVIPVNLLVGAAKVLRLRLKRGLSVKVGPKNN